MCSFLCSEWPPLRMDWCSPFSFHAHDTLVSFNFIFPSYHYRETNYGRHVVSIACYTFAAHSRPLANTDLFRPSPRHPFDENFSFIATINDDQRFHLNDFETPISKETVSDDLETHDTFIFIYYNKSDDCFEPLGNDWKTIVKIEFCKWIKRIFFC